MKGHSGDPGNDGADAQANIGATRSLQPDRDWVVLISRVRETVDNLVQTEDPQVPATPGVEADARHQPFEASERPAKMPRNSRLGPVDTPLTALALKKTSIKPCDPFVPPMLLTPARPPRSPLRPSVTTTSNPAKATIYSKPIHQMSRTIERPSAPVPVPAPPAEATMPFPAPRPQTPPREMPSGALQVTSTSSCMASPHKGASIQPSTRWQGTPKSTLSPRSPLTVSKIAPPLIPVSPRDIDLDVS